MELYKINYTVKRHKEEFKGEIILDIKGDAGFIPESTGAIRDMYNCERDDVTLNSVSKIELEFRIDSIW